MSRKGAEDEGLPSRRTWRHPLSGRSSRSCRRRGCGIPIGSASAAGSGSAGGILGDRGPDGIVHPHAEGMAATSLRSRQASLPTIQGARRSTGLVGLLRRARHSPARRILRGILTGARGRSRRGPPSIRPGRRASAAGGGHARHSARPAPDQRDQDRLGRTVRRGRGGRQRVGSDRYALRKPASLAP